MKALWSKKGLWMAAGVACAALGWVTLPASAQAPKALPMEPPHDSGQSVTGAFEGWFKNPDGTYNILVGYFNRNIKEEIDIPAGPNNKIEPGGPDQGQPTHFLPRRQWGMFTVTVPKDFGTKRLTWTITANGQTTQIPLDIDPLWEISPFHEEGIGNTPPVISLQEGGPTVQGPKPMVASMTASVGSPLPLTVFISDDAKSLRGGGGGAPAAGGGAGAGAGGGAAAGGGGRGGRGGRGGAGGGAGAPPADGAAAAPAAPADGADAAAAAGGRGGGRGGRGGGGGAPVNVTWTQFRGPGKVTFENAKPAVTPAESKLTPAPVFSGKATTSATFSAPGDYIIEVTGNDSSGVGGGGFQCCWTNAMIKVSVK